MSVKRPMAFMNDINISLGIDLEDGATGLSKEAFMPVRGPSYHTMIASSDISDRSTSKGARKGHSKAGQKKGHKQHQK